MRQTKTETDKDRQRQTETERQTDRRRYRERLAWHRILSSNDGVERCRAVSEHKGHEVHVSEKWCIAAMWTSRELLTGDRE